jgi:hypothetical protein
MHMRQFRKTPKPHHKLQLYWSGSKRSLATTTNSERAVAALEHKYEVRLPEDFREYLLCSAPADENWDPDGSNWWPLDRIQNIPDEFPSGVAIAGPIKHPTTHLFFADYLGWCSAWAIACGTDANRGRVAFIDGVEDRYVADNFAQFVDRYINDWSSVT